MLLEYAARTAEENVNQDNSLLRHSDDNIEQLHSQSRSAYGCNAAVAISVTSMLRDLIEHLSNAVLYLSAL